MAQPHEMLLLYQEKALRALLEDAFANVPFYRRLMPHIGNLRDEDAFELLQRIPPVSKTDLRRDLSSFTDSNWRKWWRSTSGTTGTPFRFFKDRVALINMDAAMYAAYSWYGIEIGDRQARIWGRAVTPKQKAIQNLKDVFLNRRRLSAFGMTAEKSLRYFSRLQTFHPAFFYCYPNAAFAFVQHLLSRQAPKLNEVKAVICTGEPLLEKHRLALQQVFSCPTVNEYGTTENGILAFECELGRMHILADNVLLEFLADGRPVADGEVGEIVVTELYSRSLPFIRYRTGDIGRPLFSKACGCGRSLPSLEVVEGRCDDFIIRPDGKKVYDAILAYILKDEVLQFCAIQEDLHTLSVDIVPAVGYTEDLEREYARKLRRYLGGEIKIFFHRVPEIPLETNGKLRYFISKVAEKKQD